MGRIPLGSVSAKKKGTHVLTHGKPFVARCPELGVQPTVSDLNFQTEKVRLLISQFSRQLLLAKFLYEGSLFPLFCVAGVCGKLWLLDVT